MASRARPTSPPAAPRTSKRLRLSGADRRSSIILAAKSVFATDGYDGAKTIKIAKAAGVSEALVYRHFPSKEALYRAVLRRVVQEQDENMAAFGEIEPSGAGLVAMIVRSIEHAVRGEEAPNNEGMRLVFGSIAGDGSYARLVYRRAKRLILPQVRAAMAAAAAAGELEDAQTTPENVVNFLEHVMSMIQLSQRRDGAIVEYAGDSRALAAEAVRFCARGIGLRPDVIERALAPAAAPRPPKRRQPETV